MTANILVPTPEKEKGVKIVLSLTVEADRLLRLQNRRHGDMSRIVSELIVKEFTPKVDPSVSQPTA